MRCHKPSILTSGFFSSLMKQSKSVSISLVCLTTPCLIIQCRQLFPKWNVCIFTNLLMGLSLCLLISELHLVWLVPWPSCCSSASKQSCAAMPHNGDVIPHLYSTKWRPSLPLSSHTPAAGLTVPASPSWSLFDRLHGFRLCVWFLATQINFHTCNFFLLTLVKLSQDS